MEEKFRQIGIVIVSGGPIGRSWGSTGNKAVDGGGKMRGTAGKVTVGEKLRSEGRSHGEGKAGSESGRCSRKEGWVEIVAEGGEGEGVKVEAFDVGAAADGISVGARKEWEGCMVFVLSARRRDGRFGDWKMWVIAADSLGRMGWSGKGPKKHRCRWVGVGMRRRWREIVNGSDDGGRQGFQVVGDGVAEGGRTGESGWSVVRGAIENPTVCSNGVVEEGRTGSSVTKVPRRAEWPRVEGREDKW